MLPTLVDSEHQDRLEEFGFAVIPFLDDEGLARVAAIHAQVGPAPDDPGVALYFGFHSGSLAHKRAISDALVPLLSRRCSEVFVDHSIYLAMFITKWPGHDSGFGPHQDPTLVDERKHRGVSIWTPLVPTGVEGQPDNGVLHVVPGSHRFADGIRVRDVNHSVFSEHEEAIVAEFGVAVPTRPGEAIVFDNRVLHYSLPNETAEPRVVMSLGMRPRESACVLPVVTDDGSIDLYEVPDETWIEIAAPLVSEWIPTYPPIARFEPPTRRFSTAEFSALCRAVGPAPHTKPSPKPAGDVAAVDPGVFCAFCGATNGLGDAQRSGRGKAQLICRNCAAVFESTRTLQ